MRMYLVSACREENEWRGRRVLCKELLDELVSRMEYRIAAFNV